MPEVTVDLSEFLNGSGKGGMPGLPSGREVIIHLCRPINAELCLVSVPLKLNTGLMLKEKRSLLPNLREKMEQTPKISLGFLLLSGGFRASLSCRLLFTVGTEFSAEESCARCCGEASPSADAS